MGKRRKRRQKPSPHSSFCMGSLGLNAGYAGNHKKKVAPPFVYCKREDRLRINRHFALLMLKKIFHCFGATPSRGGKSPNRKNIGGSSLPLVDLSLQQKDLNVRIIHAGGLVELYQNGIIAYEVIEKYPGMQLSRPEIFKQPHESVIHPYERLLPGQKFYLVPSSTVRKLKRNHSRMQDTVSRKRILIDDSDSSSFEHSFRSAKDFFLSRCALSTGERVAKKPFRPPIEKPRLTKGIGWQPSLNSVEEVSP